MRPVLIVGLVICVIGISLLPVLNAASIDTSLCELDQDPDEFYGQRVRLTAEYRTDDTYYTYLWDPQCSASVSIVRTEDHGFSPEFFDGSTAFVENYILHGTGLFTDTLADVRATFIGKFSETDLRGHMGPLGDAIFVESVSDITMNVNCEFVNRRPELDAPQC